MRLKLNVLIHMHLQLTVFFQIMFELVFINPMSGVVLVDEVTNTMVVTIEFV